MPRLPRFPTTPADFQNVTRGLGRLPSNTALVSASSASREQELPPGTPKFEQRRPLLGILKPTLSPLAQRTLNREKQAKPTGNKARFTTNAPEVRESNDIAYEIEKRDWHRATPPEKKMIHKKMRT